MTWVTTGHRAPRRDRAARVLPMLVPVLLLVTASSCWLRFDLLPADALGQHVRASLREPDVRDELARRIARAVAASDPRLAAAEPVLRTAADILIESRQFADIVDIAVQQARRAVVRGRAAEATRLEDIEAQLRVVLEGLDPSLAQRVPTHWDTAVVDLRPGSPIAGSLRFAQWLASWWWVFVAATATAFLSWIALARRRSRTLAVIGVVVAAVGAVGIAAVWPCARSWRPGSATTGPGVPCERRTTSPPSTGNGSRRGSCSAG